MEAHNHEIGSLKHRVGDLEEQTQTIQSLALSIDRLANSMERMAKEQEQQGLRLKKLEDEPAERWNSAKKTAFTTIVSVVAGALATGLIIVLAQYI
nr:hypothetical protein [Lientehia hominis]